MPIKYHEREFVKMFGMGELILTDDWKINWGDEGRSSRRRRPWWVKEGINFDIGTAEHVIRSGFRRIAIKRDDNYISCMSHRLIWQYLYGDIPANLEIKHINGIRMDNRPENLEVTEHHKIMKYSQSQIGDYIGTPLGEKAPWAKLTNKLLEKALREVNEGKSVRQIAREMDVNPITLNDALIGNTWQASFTSNLKKDRRIKVAPKKRALLVEEYLSIPVYEKSGRKKRGEVEKLLAKYGISFVHMQRLVRELNI